MSATRELADLFECDPLELVLCNPDRPWAWDEGSNCLGFVSLSAGDVVRLPDGREAEICARMGAAFSDFATAGSQFSGAWGEIQAQLNAENATTDDLNAAKQAFTDQYASLISSQFGIAATDAIDYAKKYTVAARTVVGAVQSVAGLISAAQGASTPAETAAVFQSVIGTLIGAAVAAGAASAGLGAIVVAAVGVAIKLFEDAGFFGATPRGTEICPGFFVDPAPAWVVGCACAPHSAVRSSPGSANWRRFPESSTDPGWYNTQQGAPSFVQWHGETWGWPSAPAPGSLLNPSANQGQVATPGIVYALPDYLPLLLGTGFFLEQRTDWHWFMDFHLAFVAAWKANKEFAFNGLKTQDDWQVLLHVANLWNRAHDASSYTDLSSYPTSPVFEQTVLAQAFYTKGTDDPASSLYGGKLRIHTGPRKVPKRVIAFHLGPAPAAPSTLSTGAKVGIGVAAAAAAGAGLWVWLGRPLTVEAIKLAMGRAFR